MSDKLDNRQIGDDEFESVEMDITEADIRYYLYDENDNEIGFVIEEYGREIECYYEEDEVHSEEIVEMEYSEDDILYFLVDEDDNEIGFVIEEDGCEVECYYDDAPKMDEEERDDAPSEEPAERGYLSKLATIAGHEGNKARAKAEVQLDRVRGKAEVQVDKAKKAASEQASKAKAKAEENDLGITREGIKETTNDLNALAKEGAETAKELKEAYDDIMDNFGFLMPKKVRRRLP